MDPAAGAPSSGPSATDPASDALTRTFAQEGRWEELVSALIERAATAAEARERVALFVRAAAVYEEQLQDLEKAGITLQAALAEDPGDDAAATALERVTTAQGRWPEVLAEQEGALAQVVDPRGRFLLLTRLADWYQRHTGEAAAAEAKLAAALAIAPNAVHVARTLADLRVGRGDLAGAAVCLWQTADAVGPSPDAAELLVEAAGIYRGPLSDPAQAASLYARVLEIDPENAAALQVLADQSFAQHDWQQSLALYERLSTRADGGATPSDRARLHQRAALAALQLGDDARARAHGLRAVELDPSAIPFARELAETSFERGWWEEAARLYDWLLSRPDSGLHGAERMDVTARLGRALVACNDPQRAITVLDEALRDTPDHRGCREALVAAHDHLGDAAAALSQKRALAATVGSPEERFDLLVDTAKSARDTPGQEEAALAAFREALELRPAERWILHEMLELHTALKQWKRAVEILVDLAEGEEPPSRARYLVAAANILNYELKSHDQALELYERVLDDDPSDLKSFERIDKILTTQRAWRDEARAYRRMIKRLGAQPAPEQRGTLLALWRGLGEIYRTRLEDWEAASAAYDVCTQLDPGSLTDHEILAELFEAAGPDGQARAVAERTLLFERAQEPSAMARHLRALRQLYTRAGRNDRVFCVCAALVVLGQADESELQFYQQLVAEALPMPQAATTEEIWQKVIYHPAEERHLSLAFSCVSSAVAMLRAQEPRNLGLTDRHRVDVVNDPSTVARLLELGSRMFGVRLPSVFARPDMPGLLELVNVREQGMALPALVVGAEVMTRRDPREIAFAVGRALALLRPEHLVLSPYVIGSPAELRVVIGAAMKLVQPALPVVGEEQPALGQYLQLFQRALPPQVLEPLSAAFPWLAENQRHIDIDGWRAGAERTADRAGLLFCGDIGVATRMVGTTRGPAATAAIAELLRWSVSDGYLSLREQLGLVAVADGHPE